MRKFEVIAPVGAVTGRAEMSYDCFLPAMRSGKARSLTVAVADPLPILARLGTPQRMEEVRSCGIAERTGFKNYHRHLK